MTSKPTITQVRKDYIVTIEMVTPKRAAELLISTKNRTLKKTAVAQAFGDRNRVRNLRRDRNRAAIRLTALREALAMVLLAVACADGEPHPVPNPDVYLSRCGGA